MYKFNVTILGSSSAIPTTNRNATSQLVNHNDHLYLVDCGEGTQVTIRKMHIHFQKIEHIFISHLHGDHFFGLIGLISSMHLLGRTRKLDVYGPPELKSIIDLQLEASLTVLQYPLVFHPTQADKVETIYENEALAVKSFPVLHRMPTTGFLFTEKMGERRIRKDVIGQLNIPVEEFACIKKGASYKEPDGTIHTNESITLDPFPVRSYAYCADTAYFEDIIPVIRGVELLYHETTFMQDKAANAAEKYHSTAQQAATIALKAGVKKLIIGHYSARYDELSPLLEEALQVFPDTELAVEGMKFEVQP